MIKATVAMVSPAGQQVSCIVVFIIPNMGEKGCHVHGCRLKAGKYSKNTILQSSPTQESIKHTYSQTECDQRAKFEASGFLQYSTHLIYEGRNQPRLTLDTDNEKQQL